MNNFFFNNQYPDVFHNSSSPDNFLIDDSNQCNEHNQFSNTKFPSGGPNHILNLKNTTIREVWDFNFEEEIYKIMDLIENYNVIAVVLF